MNREPKTANLAAAGDPDFVVTGLVEAAKDGNRRAIGRLLTLIERGGQAADEIAEHCGSTAGTAHVVGITGAPGAGKSTLTGWLCGQLAEAGRTPAVLAVDSSSPLSGGAILGDRVRMDTTNGIFVRSMATRGHGGGLSLSVPAGVRLFDAVGFDPVIIETVGVGQVEVDVVAVADTAVVVVNPGWGDALQANKAGQLEMADVFVVNKADRPGACDARRDLELMLDLSHVSGLQDRTGYRPPIVMTTATKGYGISELLDAVVAHQRHLKATDQLPRRRSRRLRAEIRSRLRAMTDQRIDAALDQADFSADCSASPATLAAGLADDIW